MAAGRIPPNHPSRSNRVAFIKNRQTQLSIENRRTDERSKKRRRVECEKKSSATEPISSSERVMNLEFGAHLYSVLRLVLDALMSKVLCNCVCVNCVCVCVYFSYLCFFFFSFVKKIIIINWLESIVFRIELIRCIRKRKRKRRRRRRRRRERRGETWFRVDVFNNITHINYTYAYKKIANTIYGKCCQRVVKTSSSSEMDVCDKKKSHSCWHAYNSAVDKNSFKTTKPLRENSARLNIFKRERKEKVGPKVQEERATEGYEK